VATREVARAGVTDRAEGPGRVRTNRLALAAGNGETVANPGSEHTVVTTPQWPRSPAVDGGEAWLRDYDRVARAIVWLDTHRLTQPRLADVARALSLSPTTCSAPSPGSRG
jgi:hypothetical protein